MRFLIIFERIHNALKKSVIKILAILIVLVICVLCSCDSKDNKLLDLDGEVKEPKNFKFKTEHTEYDSDTKTILYSITNICDEEIGIGTEFELQYKVDNDWKDVAFKKDVFFYGYAWILNPGESKMYELELEEYYNLPLKPGEYRMAKDGYGSNVFNVN